MVHWEHHIGLKRWARHLQVCLVLMSKHNCGPKALTHSRTFSCGCLAITASQFFLRFSTLLIQRISARLHGRVYICPRSACVTTSLSHSRAKPQLRNWSRRVVTHLEHSGPRWLGVLWRSEKPPDIRDVTQRRVVTPEAGWRTSVTGSLRGHYWVTLVGSVRVCGLHYSDIRSLLEILSELLY